MPRTRTRTAIRDRDPERRPHDPDAPPARFAQLRRDIRKKMVLFRASPQYAQAVAQRDAKAAAQQKAPDLATGGSADSGDELKT